MPQVVRIAEMLVGKVPEGESVTVQGWVRTRRDSKAVLSFLHFHDSSASVPLQVVAQSTMGNYDDEILHLTAGCAVRANGSLVESQGKDHSVELQAESVDVIGWVDDPDSYPISPKRHTFEYLSEVPHLRVRANTIGAVTRVRNSLAMAIRRYFLGRGFYWIYTPIVTTSDAEGDGEMFRVPTLDLANLPQTSDGAVDFSPGSTEF